MNDPRWARLTTISADPEGGARADVSNSLVGKRYRISSRELAAALLRNTTPESPAIREELTTAGLLISEESSKEIGDGVDHWRKRSWGLALDYFLWSRRTTFDDGASTKDERRRAASRLLALAGPPPSPPAATEQVGLPRITLPAILPKTENDLAAVLRNRRSSFGFAGRDLRLESVAAILWSALEAPRGCRNTDTTSEPLDVLRSFGIAFDFYFCAYQVTGVAQGCYRYDLKEHAIEPLASGDLRPEMRRIVIGQPSLERASASVILVADFDRYLWRYRHERALRNLYIEAGRLVQYLLLAATAMRIRTHITPAIRDGLALELLDLPPERHQAFYVLTIG